MHYYTGQLSRQAVMNGMRTTIPDWEDIELYNVLYPPNDLLIDIEGMVAYPAVLLRRYQDNLRWAQIINNQFATTGQIICMRSPPTGRDHTIISPPIRT